MQAMIPINEAPLEVTRREQVDKVHHESEIKEQDVLLGRGKCNFKHIGNMAYRMLIETRLEKYIASDSRSEKTHMVVEVVESIFESGGRFLKQEQGSSADGWFVVNKKTAREKVGHSFRDAIKAKNGVITQVEEKRGSSISAKSSFSEILRYIERENSWRNTTTTAKGNVSRAIGLVTHSESILQALLKSDETGSSPSQSTVPFAQEHVQLRDEPKMQRESTSSICYFEQISKRAAEKYKSLSEDARIRAINVAKEKLSPDVRGP